MRKNKRSYYRALVEQLLLDGMDDEYIALVVGKNEWCVSKVRRELGLKKKNGYSDKCAKLRDEIIAYRRKKHTIKETANRFHVSEQYVKKTCAGLSIGYAHEKPQQTQEDCVKKKIEAAWKQWVYIDGYNGTASRVRLRCRKCGSISEWSMVSLRHYEEKRLCPVCDRVIVRDVLNIQTFMRHWESEEKERIKKETPKPRKEPKNKCAVCGRLTTRKKYCSVECSNKANNAAHDLKKRMFAKSKIVDKDITLKKLYLRDKGICWICGMMCDYSDYRRTEKAFIAGNLYPSIDHVIPRCEGGEHSWKNIRLAHRKCNTARYSWDRRKEHTQSYIAV